MGSSNETRFFVQFVYKSNYEDLNVFLAQARKELFLLVETVSVFAVSDDDQSATFRRPRLPFGNPKRAPLRDKQHR